MFRSRVLELGLVAFRVRVKLIVSTEWSGMFGHLSICCIK